MCELTDGELGLPAELARLLPDDAVREALAHPDRRQILRALHRGVERLSVADIVDADLVPGSLASVDHHVRVLVAAGLLGVAAFVPAGSSELTHFTSLVDDDGPVPRVLLRTQPADERRQNEST